MSLVSAGGARDDLPEAVRLPVSVAATTSIVGDIVRQVGGDRVAIQLVVPVGVDPHAFQATPRDVRVLAGADIVFAVGAGLEAGFLALLQENVDPARISYLADVVALRRLDEDEGAADTHDDESAHTGLDPHIWMDPSLVASWVPEVAQALSRLDPDNAVEYAHNGQRLQVDLDDLDRWVQEQVRQIAPVGRVLVTDHEVLGYFAARYGFSLLATVTPGLATTAEPSARHLAQLHTTIEEHQVAAIFVGNTINPRIATSLAADLGIPVVALFTGSLSGPGGPAPTYQEFVKNNVNAIVSALR